MGQGRERGKPPLFTRLLRNSGNKVLQGTPTIRAASTFLLSFFQTNFPSCQLLTSAPDQYSSISTTVRPFPHSWVLKLDGRLSLLSSPMLLHQLLVQKSKSQRMSSIREDVTTRFSLAVTNAFECIHFHSYKTFFRYFPHLMRIYFFKIVTNGLCPVSSEYSSLSVSS